MDITRTIKNNAWSMSWSMTNREQIFPLYTNMNPMANTRWLVEVWAHPSAKHLHHVGIQPSAFHGCNNDSHSGGRQQMLQPVKNFQWTRLVVRSSQDYWTVNRTLPKLPSLCLAILMAGLLTDHKFRVLGAIKGILAHASRLPIWNTKKCN